jgi:hypothetical protein
VNSPFTLFNETTKAATTLFGIWPQVMRDYQLRQEAELQQALLAPTGDNARALPRIDRISAATRAFLDHNQMLTFWSCLPAVRWYELTLARNFIHAFQEADHALWQVAVIRPPLAKWREPKSYRDELGQLASSNATIYQTVRLMEVMPPGGRQPIVQMLSGQLVAEHERNHSTQQME